MLVLLCCDLTKCKLIEAFDLTSSIGVVKGYNIKIVNTCKFSLSSQHKYMYMNTALFTTQYAKIMAWPPIRICIGGK